jgi:uncharacterized protein
MIQVQFDHGHEARDSHPSPRSEFSQLAIELFRTDQGYHVFDAQRVVFMEVDRVTYDLLTILRDRPATVESLVTRLEQHAEDDVRGAYDAILALQQEGFLSPQNFKRSPRFASAAMREKLSHEMKGITLFVSTRCNLACTYCCYGGGYARYGTLSQRNMSWETAKNALDFLIERSEAADKLAVSFIGGEPLVAYPMIKRCIEYVRRALDGSARKVSFTIATNGTLLDDAMLEFLIEHRVTLQISLDGERTSHDSQRRFKGNGRGSFDAVLRSLERIRCRDLGYLEQCVEIKGVMTRDTMACTEPGFLDHPAVKVLVDKGSLKLVHQIPQFRLDQDAEFFSSLKQVGRLLLQTKRATSLAQVLEPLNYKQRAFFDKTFSTFFEVQADNKLYYGKSAEVDFAKSCVVGLENAAVSPDGDIAVCTNATTQSLGNVNHGGWDFEKVDAATERLYRDPGCSSCFVQRFCDLCPQMLQGDEAKSQTARFEFCAFTKYKFRLIFRYMLQVLETNPEVWKDADALVTRYIEAARAHQPSPSPPAAGNSAYPSATG